MELKEGMYVRTKNNGICKLYREFHEDSVDVGIGVFPEIDGFFIDKEEINYIEKDNILKSNKNIIDLIEVGDYVNGVEVIGKEFDNFNKEYLQCGVGDYVICTFEVKDIKTILTKEQYENNVYRIGE